MGLLEAAYLVGRVGVGPSVSHLSRLWCPEVHAPGQGNGGIGVAGGEFRFRLRPYQGGDIVGHVGLCLRDGRLWGEKAAR